MQEDNGQDFSLNIHNRPPVTLPKPVKIPPGGITLSCCETVISATIQVMRCPAGSGVKAQISVDGKKLPPIIIDISDGETNVYYAKQTTPTLKRYTLTLITTPDINKKSEVVLDGSNWQ